MVFTMYFEPWKRYKSTLIKKHQKNTMFLDHFQLPWSPHVVRRSPALTLARLAVAGPAGPSGHQWISKKHKNTLFFNSFQQDPSKTQRFLLILLMWPQRKFVMDEKNTVFPTHFHIFYWRLGLDGKAFAPSCCKILKKTYDFYSFSHKI